MTDSVRRTSVAREYRHGMRGESVRRCIGKIEKGVDVFGLTKGDFSMIDIVRHIVEEIGPCDIDIGTWTAAHADIKQAFTLFGDERLRKVRFLVDRSFPARQPAYYAALLKAFGQGSVRMARFHAKYILAENEEFSVAVRTSMNLNENKRIEFYELSEGSPISGYLRQIGDYHFAKPSEDSYSAFVDFDLTDSANPDAIPQTVDAQQRLGGWD
jgi:hypothetical protein